MDDDLAGIEHGLARDALARVARGARKSEGLRAVEGGVGADFADLVRVDLCVKTGRQNDGFSDTPQGGLWGLAYAAKGSFGSSIGLSGRLAGLAACEGVSNVLSCFALDVESGEHLQCGRIATQSILLYLSAAHIPLVLAFGAIASVFVDCRGRRRSSCANASTALEKFEVQYPRCGG